MNKIFLVTVFLITGTNVPTEIYTMSNRLSRVKQFFKKRLVRPKFKRNYTKNIKVNTKNVSTKKKVALLSGSAVAGYGVWDWLKEKLGFGQKTTLPAHMDFIPTPDQIKESHEKYDKNPQLQMLSHLGFRRISQVVKEIEKKLNRILSDKEKENIENLISSMSHLINPENTLVGTTVVNSIELLPLLLFVNSKEGSRIKGREDLLPKDKKYSPFVYNGLAESPLIQLFSEHQDFSNNKQIIEISEKICDFTNIENKNQFLYDFTILLNSSETYKRLKNQYDLLIIEDGYFYPYSDKKNSYDTASRGDKKARLFTFGNKELNQNWGEIYFAENIKSKIGDEIKELPAYKFFQSQEMTIKEQKRGYFSKPNPRTFLTKKAPIDPKNSIYILYEKELGPKIEELITKHGGKYERYETK